MSCACSGNRSYSAFVYQGRHDGFFSKWECFAWNVLDFFILTSRTRKIKLLSFSTKRKGNSNRGCPCKGQNLLCGDNCNCGTREKPCKNRVSCRCKKITIAIRVYLNCPSARNSWSLIFVSFLQESLSL